MVNDRKCHRSVRDEIDQIMGPQLATAEVFSQQHRIIQPLSTDWPGLHPDFFCMDTYALGRAANRRDCLSLSDCGSEN